MEVDEDLSTEALGEAMPGRPIRAYPALLSTESDALAWARADGPAGGVVAAGYQVSPRGRGGLEWRVRHGQDLAFSLILRPELSVAWEGWVYAAAICGLVDAFQEGTTIVWPDEARRDGVHVGAVGVHVELSSTGVEWAVVNTLAPDAQPPRTRLLARIVESIEARVDSSAADVQADYRSRCETIGQPVRARLIPMGPSGPQVTGRAADVLTDGSLSIRTARGNRVAVRPQHLGLLDELDESELEDQSEGDQPAGDESAGNGTEGSKPEGGSGQSG